jgi:hypothetical protein
MAKIDKIKEQINYLKLLLGVFIAILLSLIGWTANHIDNIENIRFAISIFLIFFSSIVILYINKKILSKIDELEDI